MNFIIEERILNKYKEFFNILSKKLYSDKNLKDNL